MVPVALTLFLALALFALLRTPGVFCPAPLASGASVDGTLQIPGDEDEEEMPQTDRAPSRPWLPWTVAAIAAARIVALVALHA